MRALAAAAFCATTLISVPFARVRALEQTTATPAPGLIDGAVTDSLLAPVEGATITIFQTNVRVTTGPSGRFRIQQVPAGQYLIIVQRIGFRPASGIVDVPPRDTVRLAYTLERAVVQLEATIVTEKHLTMRLAEFELRRRLGVGQFLTQEQIDARGSVYASELVRTFTGVRVVPLSGAGGMMQSVAVSTRMSSNTTGKPGCLTEIFVDGIRQIGMVNLDDLPAPREIAGMELYPGPATVPLEYAGQGTQCGVLLVWTRGG